MLGFGKHDAISLIVIIATLPGQTYMYIYSAGSCFALFLFNNSDQITIQPIVPVKIPITDVFE